MTQPPNLLLFFSRAKEYCISHGFESEIQSVRDRRFEDIDAEEFLLHYIYVILNSGMKNQVAEKIYYHFIETLDNNVIRHPGKKKAVETARQKYRNWYSDINHMFWFKPDPELLIIDYMQHNIPYCGKITSYHLARNIGLDVTKPDRHIVRIAANFNTTPQEMCSVLSSQTGERIGVIDVILWRYANLTNIYI